MVGGDADALTLELLAHGLQGVAQGGDNDGGEVVIGPSDFVLHTGLHDGAGEGGQIGADLVQLNGAAPQADGQHPAGVDDGLGGPYGEAAHGLLAGFLLEGFQGFRGRICNLVEADERFQITSHCLLPPH